MTGLAIAISEAVVARCEERARGARAFWFQARSLGSGYERQIAEEQDAYAKAAIQFHEAVMCLEAARSHGRRAQIARAA